MNPVTLLALQSLLVSLQIANVGLGAFQELSPAVVLVSSAVVGGLQFFVQHVGNKTFPEIK